MNRVLPTKPCMLEERQLEGWFSKWGMQWGLMTSFCRWPDAKVSVMLLCIACYVSNLGECMFGLVCHMFVFGFTLWAEQGNMP